MKTKCLLSAIFAIVLQLTCFGQVKLTDITPSRDTLNTDVVKDLLGKVYLHNPSILNDARVTISLIRGVSSYKIFICSVKTDNLSDEYYAVSVKDDRVGDGALLGHDGDPMILQIKVPRDEMIYKSSPNINIEFETDTIKVLRTYEFFTTARGGRWFHKEGTIYNCFVVSNEGTINQVRPYATAIRTDGDANYLSKDHRLPTTSQSEGEYFPLGMDVLYWAQNPLSHTLNIEELNNTASGMMSIVEQYDEDAPINPKTQSVMEFAKWSFNLGMRHSNEFLTWIASNPDKEKFTHFIQAVASENENNELVWLKECVKKLKDKKARKWWDKWIKENLQWSINNTK